MNKTTLLALAAALSFTAGALAAESYQVTGPILELTDTHIVVEKNKEKWAVARTADTKITGELKVGAKVTIEYTMTASTIEAKPDKTAKPAKPAITTPANPSKKPK